jgi:hypothetical protein
MNVTKICCPLWIDIRTTFLQWDLDEELYMHQLEGFILKGKEYLICRLHK